MHYYYPLLDLTQFPRNRTTRWLSGVFACPKSRRFCSNLSGTTVLTPKPPGARDAI
jgi:hypothetical protein